MGISRDIRHKRRATGGRRNFGKKKKRKFELGRQPANTKLVPGERRVHLVRCRGGRIKQRGLRLELGNFSLASENITRKARILDVVYNASNNELVRTKTLVKNCIVVVDAAPFKDALEKRYGELLGNKNTEETKFEVGSKKVQSKRSKNREMRPESESVFSRQFNSGRLFACISSRPGQCGRADGYVLEDKELAFYVRKMNVKKRK